MSTSTLLVWESAGADSAAAVPTAPALPMLQSVEIGEHSSTDWSIVSEPCPGGCWLVFGQGYNEGWLATDRAAGDLGPSRPMSGGFNGWWLAPSNEPHEIEIRFAPQRRLDLALAISLLATLACLAVVIGSSVAERRRKAAPSDAEQRPTGEALRGSPEAVLGAVDPVGSEPGPETLESVAHLTADRDSLDGTALDGASIDGRSAEDGSPVMASRAADLTHRRATLAGSMLVLLTALFVGPVWALPALAAGGALIALRRARLVASTGIAVLALVTALVVRRQVVYGYQPGGAWPSNFADLHRLTMFAIPAGRRRLLGSGSRPPPTERTSGRVTPTGRNGRSNGPADPQPLGAQGMAPKVP